MSRVNSRLERYRQDKSCVFAESLSDLPRLIKRYDVNGVPTPIKSPFGMALDFDGANDYLGFGVQSQLDFVSSDFSIAMKLKVLIDSGSHAIISRGTFNVDGWEVFINIGNSISARTYQGGAAQTTLSNVILSFSDKWLDMCVVRNGADMLIYVEGADATDFAATHTNPVSTSTGLFVGARNDGALKANGSFKDVLVWNRIITPQEVSNLYHGEAF